MGAHDIVAGTDAAFVKNWSPKATRAILSSAKQSKICRGKENMFMYPHT